MWARWPGSARQAYNHSLYEAIEWVDKNLGSDYRIIRHALGEKSVPRREHFHIYRSENAEKFEVDGLKKFIKNINKK
jgi:hypothetical protein